CVMGRAKIVAGKDPKMKERDVIPRLASIALRNATARAGAAAISARDLRDADLPRPLKSVALFQGGCGMPNGSHGLQPSRPQIICNFTLAGDAYSVSSRTVRSHQVAPW